MTTVIAWGGYADRWWNDAIQELLAGKCSEKSIRPVLLRLLASLLNERADEVEQQ
jgi:hypothetical protein